MGHICYGDIKDWIQTGESAFRKRKKVFESLYHTEPCDIGDRDHDNEEHDQDLEAALFADAEVRGVLILGVGGFADAAGLGGPVLGGVVVVFECRVMRHILYSQLH